MLGILSGITLRILSNSYINVFQKILTEKGNRASVINFFTYLGLSIPGILILFFNKFELSSCLIFNFIFMGILGALGNYFIIKALSVGELSSLAPINSYKPIIAMVIAFIYLGEIPSLLAIAGIGLIIFGTFYLNCKNCFSNKKAIFYRIMALIFSGSEAVFIKKIILLTNVPISFILWAISGFIFSVLFVFLSKNEIKIPQVKYLSLLILSVVIMQYSTNFVFSKINVSYALALFQLSTLFSIFLGANVFKENNIKQKFIASIIMIFGAVVILLS